MSRLAQGAVVDADGDRTDSGGLTVTLISTVPSGFVVIVEATADRCPPSR